MTTLHRLQVRNSNPAYGERQEACSQFGSRKFVILQ